jgi:hypothetical protein
VFYIVARGVQAEFKGIKWACKQEAFPYGSATGDAGTSITVIAATIDTKSSTAIATALLVLLQLLLLLLLILL